jgi:ABC-type polysaccharide/polyol phosphate transport system ATPase subunit/uncharacterized protein YkuJ
MSESNAIEVSSLCKIYHLYNTPIDRLKEALNPWRKKYHQDFYALKDVSFEVKKGDTIGIIGQNGSGKSTLLKILSNVLTPTSGDIKVKGRVSSLLELGSGFNPELTGIENVYFNGTLLGFTRQEMDTKLDDILSFADIGEFVRQPVKTYSSGMQVRLAFAVAINVNPEVLIVDEALAVGDIRFQQKCFRKIDEIRNKGTTIIFCTHDTGAVLNLCSSCLWIHNGIMRDFGYPDDIVRKYSAFMNYDKEVKQIDICTTTESNSINYKDIHENEQIQWTSTKGFSTFGEGGAEITEVAFFHADTKKKVHTLKGGEVNTIGIRIRLTETVSQPIVGFNIKNILGVCSFGTNTFVEGIKLHDLKNEGSYETIFFTFTFPNLGNGSYLLDVAIADGTQLTHSSYHWVHDIFTFNVFNIGDKYSFGYVYLTDMNITSEEIGI